MFEVTTDLDLDFAGANTFYATHRMHSFSAKFPPQLARWGLEEFTEPGDWVLDPMVGSGTLMVEARMMGRHSFGIDIDPLSRLLSTVKSNPLDPLYLESKMAGFLVELATAEEELTAAREEGTLDRLFKGYHADIPHFHNRDYWFLPEVQEELAIIKAVINRQFPRSITDFLYIVFSSIIITKGQTSVANVMDLAHSRPHHREPEEVPDVFGAFRQRLSKLKDGVCELYSRCDHSVQARIIGEDARDVPLPNDCIDLVFTSPPYVNAIDYPRAHKFSIFWIPEYLRVTADAYTDLSRQYIGTDRVPTAECRALLERRFGIRLLDETLKALSELDVKRAGVACRYFFDMRTVISEMLRVLKPGKRAVIVVGPSTMRGIEVPTHHILGMMAEELQVSSKGHAGQYAFMVEEVIRRVLDDTKRQLPYLRGQHGSGMREEFVIVLRKEAV